MTEDEFHEKVEELYADSLKMANKVLSTSKKFPIEVLKLEDPTYQEIAEHMLWVSRKLMDLGDNTNKPETIHIIAKMAQYADAVNNIAIELDKDTESSEGFKKAVEELNRMPFL